MVQLAALMVAGDLVAAKRLVDATPDSMLMGAREELLIDILNAVMTPGEVEAAEPERVRDELCGEELGPWIRRFCPDLIRRFDAHDPS